MLRLRVSKALNHCKLVYLCCQFLPDQLFYERKSRIWKCVPDLPLTVTGQKICWCGTTFFNEFIEFIKVHLEWKMFSDTLTSEWTSQFTSATMSTYILWIKRLSNVDFVLIFLEHSYFSTFPWNGNQAEFLVEGRDQKVSMLLSFSSMCWSVRTFSFLQWCMTEP